MKYWGASASCWERRFPRWKRKSQNYASVPFAVGVASGTDALLLSLKALGVGPGDSVVTVPFTFFATAGTVVNLGARPIFVDIEPAGFEMDPEKLSSFLARECAFNPAEKKMVHKASGTTVKAIVPVHLYGQCADMDEILEVARRYDLPVVEDACQAIGATYKGRKAGAMGDLGCFSFFPSKNLGGAGDGGMVVTSNRSAGRACPVAPDAWRASQVFSCHRWIQQPPG